jgi:hypothetical protein
MTRLPQYVTLLHGGEALRGIDSTSTEERRRKRRGVFVSPNLIYPASLLLVLDME